MNPTPTQATPLLGPKFTRFGSVPPPSTSSTSTEREGNDLVDNEVAESSASSNDSAFEFLDVNEKSGEESGEASDVELFSDLTVVVSIHMLSDLLTDGEEEGGELGDANVWWWFVLRVFYVYAMWLQYMEVANLHNLYSKKTHRADVIYYMIIFGFMAILVVLSKGCQKDQHRFVAIIYILGRIWGLAVIRLLALFSPRTSSKNSHQSNFLRRYTLSYPKYFLFQCTPLFFGLLFSWHWEHDDTAILWGGIATMALRVLVRTVIGLKCDLSKDYADWDGKLGHTEHTKERYKLITLIFLGELCFSSTSVPGNYYTSLSALVTAMGCFICYFLARVEGRVEAWNRSALCNTQCHLMHFVIFCALPTMGVGFVEIMKENGNETVNYDNEETDGESLWYDSPHAILSMGAAIFLFSLGHLELMTKDPEMPQGQTRIKRWLRVLLYHTMGLVLIGVHFLSKAAATYVPLIIWATGLALIWGVQVIV